LSVATVDTHVHVTAQDTVRYPLSVHSDELKRLRAAVVSGDELLRLMDEAAVERAVLVQASHTHGFDNNYAADVAAAHPTRFASVCCVDVAKPDAAEQLFYWIRERGMNGVRLFNATSRADPPLEDSRSLKVMEQALALDVPITMVLRHADIGHLHAVMSRLPNARVIVDHLARFPVDERPPYDNSAHFFALSRYPSLSLKYSAVNQWAIRKGATPERDYFRRIFDHFGADRLMWGSNYPVTRYKTYAELFRMGAEPFDFLTEEEIAEIMGGNALRWFWRSRSDPLASGGQA
jgi:L-fuconolactonase